MDNKPDPTIQAQSNARAQVALGQEGGLLRPIPEGQVPVVSPAGVIGLIDQSQLQEASKSGYRIATTGEARHQQIKEIYGDTASAVATGMLGGFDAVTAGFGKGLLYKGAEVLGGKQAADEMAQGMQFGQEANPGAHYLGEGLGFLVPALLTGGESAAAEGIMGMGAEALPIELAGALGRGVGEAGAGLIERGVGKGIAATTGKWALDGAAQGAVFGAGNAFSEAVVGNEDDVAEKMMAGSYKGALFGGTVGAGLGLVGGVMGKVGGGLAKRLPSAGELSEDLMTSSLRMSPGDKEWLTELGIDNHRLAQFMLEEPEIRQWASSAGKIDKDFVSMLNGINKRRTTEIGDAIERIANNAPEDVDAASMFKKIQEEIVKPLESSPFHAKVAQKMNDYIEKMGVKLGVFERAPFAEEAFVPTEFKAPEFVPPARKQRPMGETLMDTRPQSPKAVADYRKGLAADDAAEAAARAKHEAKVAKLQKAHEEGQIQARLDHIDDQTAAAAKHAKKGELLRDDITGKPVVKNAAVSIKDMRKLQEDLESMLHEGATGKDIATEFKKMRDIMDDTITKHGAHEEYTKALEKQRVGRALEDLAGKAERKQAGFGWGSMGAAMGLGFLGPKGLAFGLASKIVRERGAQWAAVNIHKATQLAALKGAADAVSLSARDAAKAIIKGGQRMATTVALDRSKQAEKTIKQVKEMALAPERIHALAKDHIDAGIAPNIHQKYLTNQVKAIQWLALTAPQGMAIIPAMPNSPRTKPSKLELSGWMKKWDVYVDPIGAIRGAARKGQLSKEHIEAASIMYPHILHEIQGETMLQFAEKMQQGKLPPQSQRFQVSLLTGAPMDGSLMPQFIMSQQAIVEQPANDDLFDNSGGGMVAPKSKARRASFGSGEEHIDEEEK